MSLGRTGYTDAERVAKESALKDALAGGVARDELAVHLINISDQTFTAMLAEAVKLDASYLARQALKGEDKYTVSVMNTQMDQSAERSMDSAVNQVGPQNFQGVVCFRCYQAGHIAPMCPLNANRAPQRSKYQNFMMSGPGIPQGSAFNCYYCHGRNHVARDCFTRKRDLRMSQSQGYGRRQNFSGNQEYRPHNYGQGPSRRNEDFNVSYSNPGQLNFRAPLEDKASLAYNAALERQSIRNAELANRGQINAAVGGRPEHGLGFEQYNDSWSPSKLIQSQHTDSKTHSTIPKNLIVPL